jgi:hypothetical protein
MDGFPLPPLGDMPNGSQEDARANASYYGEDMRWMIWEGANDYIFPANLTLTTYQNIFNKLGASKTLKIMHTEPGMSHWMAQSEFTQMKEFINGNDFQGSLQNLNGWDDFVNGVKGFG